MRRTSRGEPIHRPSVPETRSRSRRAAEDPRREKAGANPPRRPRREQARRDSHARERSQIGPAPGRQAPQPPPRRRSRRHHDARGESRSSEPAKPERGDRKDQHLEGKQRSPPRGGGERRARKPRRNRRVIQEDQRPRKQDNHSAPVDRQGEAIPPQPAGDPEPEREPERDQRPGLAGPPQRPSRVANSACMRTAAAARPTR